MGTVLGCIADDFTGATDLAALLARSGFPVSLRIGVPAADDAETDAAAFEVIALKIRTQPAAIAIAQARDALIWLQGAGAKRFFWKYCSTFDSTDQGNIGPVAEMLMEKLGARQTIYCPAFPQNSRSVYMGHLFVGRQLLSESPMKDHPLTPMRQSDLVRLLQPQVRGDTGLIDRNTVLQGAGAIARELDKLAAGGVAHFVVDALSDNDLATIAAAVMDMPLVTGGSAIAGELPRLYVKYGLVAAPEENRQGMPQNGIDPGRIVLSGSCSAMTRKQIAHYSKKVASLRLDPLALADDGMETARNWLRQQPLDEPKLIYATAEPDDVRHAQEVLGPDKAGQIVEQALADLAVEAFSLGIRRFVIAGGETSGAVTETLGISRLEIGREIAPGVPWTYTTVQGERIALALKSGNFGSESFFTDAFQTLEAA